MSKPDAEGIYESVGAYANAILANATPETRLAFWMLIYSKSKTIVEGAGVIQSSRPTRKAVPQPPAQNDSESYEEAELLAEQIEEAAAEVPERGQEFASSVCETAADIMRNVESNGYATTGQLNSLQNMLGGLERWIR